MSFRILVIRAVAMRRNSSSNACSRVSMYPGLRPYVMSESSEGPDVRVDGERVGIRLDRLQLGVGSRRSSTYFSELSVSYS